MAFWLNYESLALFSSFTTLSGKRDPMEKHLKAKKEATLFGGEFIEKATKRMEKEKALPKVTGSHGSEAKWLSLYH